MEWIGEFNQWKWLCKYSYEEQVQQKGFQEEHCNKGGKGNKSIFNMYSRHDIYRSSGLNSLTFITFNGVLM